MAEVMEAFIGIPFMIILIVWIVWVDRRAEKKKAKQREAERKESEKILTHAQAIVNSHAATLYRKKLQKTKYDDYGNTFDADWVSEKEYFYESVTVPQLLKQFEKTEIGFYSSYQDDAFIEEAVRVYAATTSIEEINIDRLTPTEFEAHCASLLSKAGWSARITQASGDQGVDVIAEKDGLVAVFQVKKSASAVGNKAVQEIIAGKSFTSADKAYVVTNANFTKSAKELANISGVELLHYTELKTLNV